VKGFDKQLLETIKKMWFENPQTRIPVSRVRKDVFAMTHIRSLQVSHFFLNMVDSILCFSGKNLMDHVMNMLEKYASNLEGIVAERTEQLNEERQRADNLLYQILPKLTLNFTVKNTTYLEELASRMVADALKAGRPVYPELFDSATVYFSDIVGFTTICSMSKPGQIVTMLNELYSQIDTVIVNHEAYKVITF